MKKPVICYPRGSGGNWLMNLIWRLETNQFELPTVDVVFDGQTFTSSFLSSHTFEIYDGITPTIDNKCIDADWIKFSSPCWFNHYINDAVKVRYHISKIGTTSIADQFHLLTDSAIYIRTAPLWQSTWGSPGRVEYRLLYQDPKEFVDQLFAVLDQYCIKYTPNYEYCYASIDYYKSTCPRPLDHLNNFNSLLWLAWCHAELLISGIGLPATLPTDATVSDIQQLVQPSTPLNLLEKTKLITVENK